MKRKNKFAEARKSMSKTLHKDVGLYQGYLANVAMLIYDDQIAGSQSRSSTPPTNLSTIEGCNTITKRILKLIFD